MKDKLHIHFIGICGVAMSALAIALHEQGHIITGSDKGFFPPVSDNLEKHKINFYPGWHVEKMTADGNPDLVVVGNVAGSTNPEWQYVQEKKLEYKSYPEILAKFFIKKNSIVCTGTYGKTSTSSLLTWILLKTGYDPSYMFGGISKNDISPASIGKGNWSVMEGDEYKSARWDPKAKFFHYSPTKLLLTSLTWDHADIYPTENDYTNAFQKLVEKMPKKSLIVTSSKLDKLRFRNDQKIVTYGKKPSDNYSYSKLNQDENGIEFDITHKDNTYHIKSPLIGSYMAENITAGFAMAHTIGIEAEKIVDAIGSYLGIKRRLDKKLTGPVTVIDDIAHSPTKAAFTLETLRKIYQGNIIAVFEPNTGSRKKDMLDQYSNAFNNADTVIIPRLTKIKIAKGDKNPPIDGKKLSEVIADSHNDVKYIDNDIKLIGFLTNKAVSGDVVVFLGSHGFRNMIKETAQILISNNE